MKKSFILGILFFIPLMVIAQAFRVYMSTSIMDLPFDPSDPTGESLASEREGRWGDFWDEEEVNESQDLW